MGLFDSLTQVAGMFGQQAEGQEGQAAPQGAMGAVLQMLQSQPGGVAGVVQQFEQSGMGGVAQSWLSSGENHPVSPDQVQGALGDGAVAQVADQLGVPQDQAAGHIAQFLPLIMDHLTPGGQAPAGGGMGEIEGLLGQFMNRGQTGQTQD